MSLRDPKFKGEDRERFQSSQAWLAVLQHKAIKSAVDLRVLEEIAESAVSERHRLRAASILQKARQQAAEKLAYNEANREEVLREKGLSSSTTEHRHVLDLGAMDMEKLKALAAGPAPSVEVEAEVVEAEPDDELLPDVE